MPGIFTRSEPSIAGCFTTLICMVLLVVVFGGIIRGCQGPYWQAMRVRKSKPSEAAHLFAEDVRLDKKESGNSVFQISKLDTPSVIPEIVDLMDLPDGAYAKEPSRESLWNSLQSQASRIAVPIPAYEPSASIEIRRAQQAIWRQWIKDHHLEH